MFKKKTPREKLEEKLDRPLFDWNLKRGGTQKVSVARMLQGTQIFGGTGSGKSSGSGATIARAFLGAGFGGLVLCAKPGEAGVWKKYAEETGQSHRLVIFDKESGLKFNPILYEQTRSGEGAGETLNLVELLMNIHQLGQNYMSGGGGAGKEPFWDQALKRCITRSIDLLRLARIPVSVPYMRDVIASALKPEDVKAYNDLMDELGALYRQLKEQKSGDANIVTTREEIQKSIKENSEAIRSLREKSFCLQCLIDGHRLYNKQDEDEQITYDLVQSYFFREFAGLSDRTRSSIEEYFFGLVEPFLKGMLRKVFGQGMSDELRPERTYEENKIIIVDYSVKEWLVAGVYGQGLVKYIWQQAMERRDPLNDGYQTPVFLWVDEAQYFINPNYDSLFQTTARSSLVCTVYMTQSINNYYFAMGSRSPEARAKALLANMGTKIFHANTDFDTNHYATTMIGEMIGRMGSRSRVVGQGEGTLSDQFVDQVPTREFLKLMFGRKENQNTVEAIIVQTGGTWDDTEDSYIRAVFKQD